MSPASPAAGLVSPVPTDLLEALAAARKVLLLAHVYPDGDVLGSQLGLGLALRASGRAVSFACHHAVPESFLFLPGAAEVQQWKEGQGGHDVVVTLDTPDPGRVGGLLDGCRGPGVRVLNIDHHGDNRRYGDVNWIEPGAAATGEMVRDLLEAARLPLTTEVAVNLYTAIVTDTGSFRYSNTTPKTLRAAADLVEVGADPAAIGISLYETRHLAGLHLLGNLLQEIRTNATGTVAWMVIDHQRATSPDLLEAEEFVNYPRSIRTAKVAVLFRELGGDPSGGSPSSPAGAVGATAAPAPAVKVSLRSKGEINVARVAARFGGGGHPNAAGVVVKGRLDDVRLEVLEAVEAAVAGR
jgi:phosphoesterase RecJ-like protein